MSKFLNKNKYKIALVLVFAVVVLSLTSCRFDSGSWYAKPYTTYGQEWSDLWNGGRGFFNTLFAWPINLISYYLRLSIKEVVTVSFLVRT